MPLAALGPILMGAAGTSAAATTAAWGAIGAGAAGLGSAAINAHAAGSAADTTSAAANHAADLKAQADAQALAFQREQGENAFQNSEASRAGNYGMYAAGQKRLQSAGEALGIPGASSMEIPAYVPGVDPHLTGPTAGQALTGATGGAPIDPSKGDLGSQISAFFKSRGVSDQETPYWVSKWPELVARGQQINDPAYAMKRLAAADIFGAAPGTTTTPSAGSYLTPYAPVAQAPALQMPTASSYLVGAR